MFVVLSINANEIHKMSHRTRAENGRLVSKLQDWRILAKTPRHARIAPFPDPKNTYYCPITNFVNPVLERFDFWSRVEAVIEHLTGNHPSPGHRGPRAGPGARLARLIPPRAEITGGLWGKLHPVREMPAGPGFREFQNRLNREPPDDNRQSLSSLYGPKSFGPLSPFSSMTSSERLHVVTGSLASRKRRP